MKITQQAVLRWSNDKMITNKYGVFSNTHNAPTGIYSEKRESELAKYFTLQAGETFIDGGANVGVYTVRVANQYPSCRVIAVEPDQRNIIVLKKNLQLNNIQDRVTVVEKALYYEETELDFFINVANSCRSTLYVKDINGIGGRRHPDIATSVVKVQTVMLDKIIKEGKVGLVKLDVQGAELFALRGGQRILQQDRPNIIFEAWTQELLRDITEYIDFYGYKVQRVTKTDFFATWGK